MFVLFTTFFLDIHSTPSHSSTKNETCSIVLKIRTVFLDTFSHVTIHISIQRPLYDTRYDTVLCVRKLVTNNLRYFKVIYFHNNKFNTVITQHQIALQGLKCRAWVRNIKDSDLPNLLI